MTAARWIETRRTCLAYSAGGHFAELSRALVGIELRDCFHVTYDDGRGADPGRPRLYHVTHPRRSVRRTLRNAAQALRILRAERPELIVSTGADVAVPTLLLGKLLGARIVFIETGGSLMPSLSGRLVYPFADLFIVQWPEKLARFPRAVLADGPLL
jgi:UDP-N-acetylglucosamine:LPS N-acetylglucosamine transferase